MKFIITLVLAFSFFKLTGQDTFIGIKPIYPLSKKTSIVNLKNGDQIVGRIKRIKLNRDHISEITILDSNQKKKIKASEIINMFLAFKDKDAEENTIEENEFYKTGYIYYESQEIEIKKNKKEYVMLRLLNPWFCSKIKVYENNSRTAFVGEGGYVVEVENEKFKSIFVVPYSYHHYYIKKIGEETKELKIGTFYWNADEIFDNCGKVKVRGRYDWNKLEQHIINYNKKCN